MFFVGASGQLITLILTVCLPFILILSGNKEIDFQQNTGGFSIYQNQAENSFFNSNTFHCDHNFYDETQNNNIEVLDFDVIKLPHFNFRVKWKSFYHNNSGNKAPPTSNYFLY